MKLKVGLIFAAIVLIMIGVGLVYPNYLYFKILKKGEGHSLFYLKDAKGEYAQGGGELLVQEAGSVENPELWQKFQLRDVVVPLPVRHPLYSVAPVIRQHKKGADIGIRILRPDGRELAKILFLPTDYLNPKLDQQELFKIPLFRSGLAKINRQKLWEDLFSKDLKNWELSYGDMVYNLFLFDLRHRFFPKKTQNFYLFKNKKYALIEVKSVNRDYRTELILNYHGGVILSYIIITDLQTEGALNLRNYFLNNISLEPGSKSLSRIIYREFKALPYERRTDLEGMTYLFSAWSHDLDNREFVRGMVENLERGKESHQHQEQLKELYSYAYKKYQTTFSERNIDIQNLDDEIKLLRSSELETQKEILDEKRRPEAHLPIEVKPQEKFRQNLKKARKFKSKENKIRID